MYVRLATVGSETVRGITHVSCAVALEALQSYDGSVYDVPGKCAGTVAMHAYGEELV